MTQPTPHPTPAQLRYLLHLIRKGGRSYSDGHLSTTVAFCKNAGWTETLDCGDWEVPQRQITAAGEEAAYRADPDAYVQARTDYERGR